MSPSFTLYFHQFLSIFLIMSPLPARSADHLLHFQTGTIFAKNLVYAILTWILKLFYLSVLLNFYLAYYFARIVCTVAAEIFFLAQYLSTVGLQIKKILHLLCNFRVNVKEDIMSQLLKTALNFFPVQSLTISILKDFQDKLKNCYGQKYVKDH